LWDFCSADGYEAFCARVTFQRKALARYGSRDTHNKKEDILKDGRGSFYIILSNFKSYRKSIARRLF
jgi:hypothetical protein